MKTNTKTEPNNADEVLPTASCSPLRSLRHARMTGSEANDFACDFSHENGNYFNTCIECDTDFVGHKRRMVCNVCTKKYQAKRDAMTDEELKAHDDERTAQTLKYLEDRKS